MQRTRLGVIGFPLLHSLSPLFQQAGLDAAGRGEICYEKLETPHHALHEVVERVRAEFLGVNITVPYKEKIMPWMDRVLPEARLAGAVNTIRVEEGKLVATNTDGAGFMQSLETYGIPVSGGRFLLLGAGGAARGVGTALAQAGAARLDVASRRRAPGLALTRILASVGTGPSRWYDLRSLDGCNVAAYDMIVNTTPVGMAPDTAACLSFPFDHLRADQILYDLIYLPAQTRFLAEGGARGLRTVNGAEMLLNQGLLSFEFWLGIPAPADAMRRALASALETE